MRLSITVNVDDSLGEGLRSFLRQIVPDATLYDPVRVFAREFTGIGTAVRVRCTVGITFKGDGRHGDDRACGKPFFEVVIFWLAFNESLPPAVVVDHDFDMIWVLEGRCTAIECGIIEVPLRRGELPDELCKIMPVFLIAVPAAFRGKVKLIPPLELSLRRQRRLASRLAADQITAHGDDRLAAFWPERRHDVGRPRSPIKARDDRLLDLESIHEGDDVESNY